MAELDPGRFPRAGAYAASLSAGLATYPQCTARPDASRQTLKDFPTLLDGVPASFRAALDKHLAGDMMPDTWNVALRLLVRDVALADDDAFFRWHLDISARVFSTPLYRMLMHVMSPTIVVTNASKRWNAFRTGTELKGEWRKNGGGLTLTYPAHLYPRVMTRAFAESFRAALQAAHARNVSIEVTEYTPEVTRYALGWE